jgi:hypothetical protein
MLLLLGGVLWLATYCRAGNEELRLVPLLCAVGLGAIRPLNRWCFRNAERLGTFSSRHRLATGVTLGLLTAVCSLIYIHSRGDGLCLKMHDDHVYVIEARMLAQGRLWLPSYPPELQPFFDSFHLLMRPVYAGMYQPGTAMMLTPGVWLHLPFWAMPVVASTAVVAMLFLILEEMFGGLRALLGVGMMVCGYWLRYLATAALSELPLLLAELILWWAWMRWRKNRCARWTALMGAAAGYCAITRPLDALCFCSILGLAIIIELRRQGRLLLKTFAILALAAAPFLFLQAVQDVGLAGKWYSYAESAYLKHVFPAPPIGFFTPDYSRLDVGMGIEKKTWLYTYIVPMYQNHTLANVLRSWYPAQFENLILMTLPHSALLMLIPVGLLSLRDLRRATLAACIPLFLVAYACVIFFMVHYFFPLIPSMICMVFMGWDSLEQAWPARREAIGGFLLVAIATLAVADLPLFNPVVRIDSIDFHDREQRAANEALATLPRTPAVVLFRFDPYFCDPHDEPVYNDDVAWPDDALIVRARDLGPNENWRLIDYYAHKQPNRIFYIYDRAAIFESRNPLSPPLGTAEDLARGGAY